MSDLAAALMVAIRVHAGQVDQQGEPYLLHVLRVVGAVSDKAKVVAALHDVVEDSALTLDPVAEECGLSALEGLALSLLTRPKSETYSDYISRLADESAANWSAQDAVLLAREVKLADLRDNLGRIPPPPYGHEKWGDSEASMAAYEPDWASLKARYEKAITSLESAPAGRWGTAGQR
jgi:(p)ppGpp synthase/HD superfamily hydrolase